MVAQPSPAAKGPDEAAAWSYRMKDLCDFTGLPRQAIHFYIHEGLVPEGRKTGRNTAVYGEEHVERIKLVRRLQHERFLPLKAIRAVLDERVDAFSPAQNQFLAEVKQWLPSAVAPGAEERETVDAKQAMTHAGVDRRDFDELATLGVLATTRGPRGKVLLAKDDVWLLDLWGQVRAAGVTRALGFGATETMSIFEEGISRIFEKETVLLSTTLSRLPPAQAAELVMRALPLIHQFLVRYHETKLRNFFATL